MAKILLIYDDYNELTMTESFFKKVGFDVIGVPSDYTLSEQLLGFNPEAVVVFGKSSRLNGVQVCRKIKETESFKGKVILLVMSGSRPQPQDIAKIRLDVLLEFPVTPVKLIEVVTKILGLSTENAIEKYLRTQNAPEDPNKIVPLTSPVSSSTPAVQAKLALPTEEQNKLRAQKYAQYTAEIQFDIKNSTIKSSDAKKKWKELKQGWDLEHLSSLDQLKKLFTKALFTKKG